jgi:cytochrome c oxidase assembly factor CtaG
MADPLAPLTAATAVRVWQFAPVVSTGLAVVAAAYLAGAWRVGRRHPARPWPARRSVAFLGGLAVIALTTQSSLGGYDDVLFSVHMVQHVLLIMVAPPLLVLGRPVTLLLHAAGNPVHTWVKRAVRSPVVTALTWPPVAITGYCVVVISTHLTPLMDLVLENSGVHDAEHLLYLVAGYVFFLPVVGSEPIRWRLSRPARFVMLLIVMPVDTLAGVILMIAPGELFPPYLHTGRTWGPSPLADLHAGGIIMWAGGDLVMTAVAAGLAVLLVHGAGQAARGRAAEDEVRLAAYNAYLASLGSRGRS